MDIFFHAHCQGCGERCDHGCDDYANDRALFEACAGEGFYFASDAGEPKGPFPTHDEAARAAHQTTEDRPVVKLVGGTGNGFAIIAICQRAAQRARWSPERWAAVEKQMRSGDYDHLLQTALKHFDVR